MFTFPLKDNPRATTRIAVETVFIALDFVVAGLRLWARRIQRTSLGFSDYTILAALFLTTANFSDTILDCILGGNGLHRSEIDAIDKGSSVVRKKLDMTANLLWCVIVTLIKLSILSLYIVIFYSVVKFRRVVYGVMATQVVLCCTFIVGILVQCQPLPYYWDKTIAGGACAPDSVGFILTAVLNMLMDLVVIFLPVRIIWRLQMDKRRKAAVTIVFGLGAIVCLVTIVRLILVFNIDYNDETYTWIIFGMFTTLEFYLGIITACLPLLPPVGLKIVTWFRGSRFSSALSWTRRSIRHVLSRDSRTISGSGGKSNDKSMPNNREHSRYHDGYYYPLEDQKPQRNLRTTYIDPHPSTTTV